jgi:hypothetical protein
MFVTTVGKISPASASSGDRNIVSPDMSTKGIAKPTTPLINPATSPTPKANAHSPGVIKVKNMSMGLFIPSLTIGAREIIYVILNQIAALKRIFIVLHLRKVYVVFNQIRELTDGT